MSIDKTMEHYRTGADDMARRCRRSINVAREATCQQSR
jgi:hypothetical protein